MVDDDRDFAESLADVLRLEGHEVATAYTGEDAISRFREESFDLAFIDVRLPGLNGVQSFREIRRLRPSAQVYMMTGYSVQQLLDEALALGARGVLSKPLDIDVVLKAVDSAKPAGVLIVDDDPDFVAGIEEVLRDAGYMVHIARDGEEAIERVIAGGKVDILILDLRLPLLSGLEVFLELRERKRELPTIIVTAYAREYSSELNQLSTMRVTGILVKPFNPADLLALLAELPLSTDGR